MGYTIDLNAMRAANSLGYAIATGTDGTTSRGKVLLAASSTVASCAAGTHFAVWTLHFDTTPDDISVLVDIVDGHVRWTFCPPKLDSLTFTNKVTTSPRTAGEFVWHAVFDSDAGEPTEAQAIVRLPWILTLTRIKSQPTLAGRVTANKLPVAKVPIVVLRARRSDMRGADLIARTATDKNGRFKAGLRKKGTAFVLARAAFDTFDASATCVSPSSATCVDATFGLPYGLQTRALRIVLR